VRVYCCVRSIRSLIFLERFCDCRRVDIYVWGATVCTEPYLAYLSIIARIHVETESDNSDSDNLSLSWPMSTCRGFCILAEAAEAHPTGSGPRFFRNGLSRTDNSESPYDEVLTSARSFPIWIRWTGSGCWFLKTLGTARLASGVFCIPIKLFCKDLNITDHNADPCQLLHIDCLIALW
jgi:hypothetical protein